MKRYEENQPLMPTSSSPIQNLKSKIGSVIDNQQQVIEKLNQRIAELEQEVERQKAIRLLDSKTSSKPPSTDILTKSEHKPPELSPEEGEPEKRILLKSL